MHCEAAAPAWRRWLLRHDSSITALAVALESRDSAEAFAREHGWKVRVVSVQGAPVHSVERQLVNRTPWMFLFDSDGVLRFDDLGSQPSVLDSVVKAAPK